MKKLFILSVFLVVISRSDAQLSYGARASATISKIKFSNSGNTIDNKPVVFGGVFGNYRFSKKISVQLDILGFVENSKIKNFKAGITSAHKDVIIRTPLVIQYSVAKGLRMGTGPQMGFALRNDNKPADWKWTMVAGYQIPFAKGLVVNAKYSFSMDRVQIKSMGSGVLQFGIGYSISRKTGKA